MIYVVCIVESLTRHKTVFEGCVAQDYDEKQLDYLQSSFFQDQEQDINHEDETANPNGGIRCEYYLKARLRGNPSFPKDQFKLPRRRRELIPHISLHSAPIISLLKADFIFRHQQRRDVLDLGKRQVFPDATIPS